MVEPERVHGKGSRAKGGPAAARTQQPATGPRRLDDLHDGVIQTLFGVGLALEAAAATAGEGALAVRLEEAAGNLAGVVRDLREYTATHGVDRLDPPELEHAIRALARELATTGGVRLHPQVDAGAAAALGDSSYPLVEMVASLLAGLARGQTPGSGTIRLRQDRRWVRLDITTEGAGAEPAPGWSREERLRLRRRAARLGWRLAFLNGTGPVVCAIVRVPLGPAS